MCPRLRLCLRVRHVRDSKCPNQASKGLVPEGNDPVPYTADRRWSTQGLRFIFEHLDLFQPHLGPEPRPPPAPGIDGSNELGIYWRNVMPLAKSALVTGRGVYLASTVGKTSSVACRTSAGSDQVHRGSGLGPVPSGLSGACPLEYGHWLTRRTVAHAQAHGVATPSPRHWTVQSASG